MELIGVFFIASGLLMLAGVAKAVRPDDTARVLVLFFPMSSRRTPSLDLTRHVVRTGALFEAALGACALLVPGAVTAALVAVSYAAFACITAYVRRNGGSLSTCGCFGRPDTPATGLHLLLNVIFVVTAVAIAAQPPHSTALLALLGNQPWAGVPLLLASGVGVWLAYLALSPLASLEASRRLIGTTKRRAVRS